MLTETKIKAARPAEKPYKLADGRGMSLFVQPTGAKLWRFRYRYAGREKMLSLELPRHWHQARPRQARRSAQVAHGWHRSERGSQEKRLALADTFETVAEEWLAKQSYSKATKDKARWVLDELLLPTLGREPTHTITPQIVLRALQAIEARGHRESAHRARQKAGPILRYAIATGGQSAT